MKRRRMLLDFTLIERLAVRQRGFTLIELLVVVAIIVALLAILMPAMGRALEVTQRAVCAGQIKQLSTASLAFASDHHGKLPEPGTDPLQWMNKNAVDKFLRPYLAETLEVTACPNWLGGSVIAEGHVTTNTGGNYAHLGYFSLANRPTDTMSPIAGYPDSANWDAPTAMARPGSGVLWVDRQVTVVTGPYHSNFTHTSGGWAQHPLNTTPLEAGCAGTNRGDIDASVTWVSQPDLEAHANPSSLGVAWW